MLGDATEYKYELDLGEPSQEILEWAKKEFGEDPDTTCDVISRFRDLIYERGECIPQRTDDAFLIKFLRARNFILPRAHRLLVNYCDFRIANPELFGGFKLRDMVKICDFDLINPLTYTDQNGRRMVIFTIAQWDPQKVSVTEMFQSTIALLQAGLVEHRTQILGLIIIFDFEGLSTQQLFEMTPSVAKKFIQVSVTCLPFKIVKMHIVNQSWIFNAAYKLVRPFMNDKMKENVHFHGQNMKSLHRHIDPKHLPKSYGGIHEHQSSIGWVNYFKTNDVMKKELVLLNYDLEGFDDKNP